ncbi:SHOCT domain-containing protein [Bacillus cereus]
MNEQEKNTFASNDHSSTTNPVNTYSVADEITKLAALKDQGILTEEEFTAKKETTIRNIIRGLRLSFFISNRHDMTIYRCLF